MEKEVEIFATGAHTSSDGVSVRMSEDDLDAIASRYDPNVFDSPAVIGHPRDNSPAYAWVKSVRRVGNKLMATLKDWDEDFHQSVKNKRYKKISASFYKPDSPQNPKPGHYYLRHVGFLGGMAPAVKGLRSVSFGEGEEGVIDFCDCSEKGGMMENAQKQILQNLREWLLTEQGQELADRIVPSSLLAMVGKEEDSSDLEERVDQLEETVGNLPSDLDSRLGLIGQRAVEMLNNYSESKEEKTLTDDTLAQEVQALKVELNAAKLEKKHQELANFVEGLGAKVRPSQKAGLVDFMMSLPEEELNFSDGRSQTPAVWLQNFLKNQPELVSLSEVSGGDAEEFSEEERQKHSAYADAAKAYEEAWR